jgi:hypothetical protein
MGPCKNYAMKCRCQIAFIGVLTLFLTAPPAIRSASDPVVPEGTRISLQLNDHLSTKGNNEGDSFTAVVISPIYAGDQMVIPKGSIVSGSISRIIRPGRFKGKAVMTLLFETINIPGRAQLPIVASLLSVDPEGNAGVRPENTVEGRGSAGADVGKVVAPGLAGTGIGTLAGGGTGAGIGAGVGAAIGLTSVFATRGKDLQLRRGSTMDIVLDRPLVIIREGEGFAGRSR